MAEDYVYVGISNPHIIKRKLLIAKREIYIRLYKILKEIRDHEKNLNIINNLINRVNVTLNLIKEIEELLPNVDTEKIEEENLIKYKQTKKESLVEEIDIKPKKRKRKSKETDTNIQQANNGNISIKEYVDKITEELKELQEELKRLLQS